MVRRLINKETVVVTPSERFEIKFQEEPDGEPTVPDAPTTGPIVQRKYYKCNSCKAKFERSYQLKRHTFVAHSVERDMIVSKPVELPGHNVQVKIIPQRTIQKMSLNHKRLIAIQPKTQSERVLQVRSPATINANKQQTSNPITTIYKSQIFTNGSIPFKTITPPPPNPVNPPPSPAPPRCTLSFAPNMPKPFVEIINPPPPPPVKENPKPSYPRIIVRKEPPTQTKKFDETTKDEWSQIVYEISSTGPVLFKCAVCDRSYESLITLDSHLQSHNGLAFRYKCELCDDYVASVIHLRNHVHSHTCSTELPLKCDRCEHRFVDQTGIESHDCQSEPSAICQLCRQTFLTDSLLRSHLFLHTRVKPYKCDSCNTRFIHLASLTKHKEIETSCAIVTDNSLIIGI